MNAQGEDVVAGVRTSQTIDQLAEVMPEAYKQFTEICAKLEYHYRDMQDMEFTIEVTRSSTCCRPATASVPLLPPR